MIKKRVNEVTQGMILGKTIYGDNYEILLKKGVKLTSTYIDILKKRGFLNVFIEDKNTEDIVIEDPISDKIRMMATKDILKVYETTRNSLVNIEAETQEGIIKCIHTKIKKNFLENPAFNQLIKHVHYFLEEVLSHDLLSGLNSIKSVDNYTYEHSVDSAVISLVLAKKLCLSDVKMKQLAIGEFLHDIGKIFVNEKILNKPDILTPEEYDLIKQHTVYGYELLRDNDNIGLISAHIPYQHHERQDGKGYPRGLLGANKVNNHKITYEEHGKLIMVAEIATIADVYDACISDRPFRPGIPPDIVYELIKKEAGTHFNKELTDVFLSIIPKYPIGSEISIKNGLYKGFTGYVTSVSEENILRPKIKIMHDKKNNPIKPMEIDLRYDNRMEIECVRYYKDL